jgi:hypothetical protein
VKPDSVAPQPVEAAVGGNVSSAPPPVDVPRAQPQQRVYASEISRTSKETKLAPTTSELSTQRDQPSNDKQEGIGGPADIPIPANIEEAINDPALDELKTILGKLRRPAGKIQARRTLNQINTRDGWRNVAKVVREMRDPDVRRALREVAFELRSPESRTELRRILTDIDRGAATDMAADLAQKNPQQVREEFQDLLKRLREDK